ncbi:MAG: DUF721 domain-containing protein [Bdellovibrionaceae bacterium]|nr:DUF721 domain-containing protein [Pseudobdellovibrionaceae bacterium]
MSNKKPTTATPNTSLAFKKPFRPSRVSRLETSAHVLESTFKGKSFFSQGFIRWRVWGSWSNIVGEELAKHTEPVFHRDGCLSIWADTPALAQDLSFSSELLKQKINEFVESEWVKSLRITSYKKQSSVKKEMIKKLQSLF